MNKHLKIICLVLVTSSNTIVYGQPKTALSANKNPVLASIAKQESALIAMSDKLSKALAFLGCCSLRWYVDRTQPPPVPSTII